jgi:transcriptional regulator with XRE-family HTH domain
MAQPEGDVMDDEFSNNLARLLGLHALPAKEAATLLGMSQSAFSKWSTGARRPSFPTAIALGDFFGVPADRLARARFEDLLGRELADVERFRRVEAEIARRRAAIEAQGDKGVFGLAPNVVAIAKLEEERGTRRK